MYDYKLDMGGAIKDIQKFKKRKDWLASDHLVAQDFANLQESLRQGTAVERVVLLDALFGTNLSTELAAINRIADNLEENRDELEKRLGELGPNDLEEHPGLVIRAASQAIPLILERPEKTQKHHYSFATKFLHWSARVHFPVVDSKARTSVNRFQRSPKFASKVGNEDRVCASLPVVEKRAEDYGKWARFYSNLLNNLSPDDKRRLAEEDERSQKNTGSGFFVKNSLLRILDKVFYMRGK